MVLCFAGVVTQSKEAEPPPWTMLVSATRTGKISWKPCPALICRPLDGNRFDSFGNRLHVVACQSVTIPFEACAIGRQLLQDTIGSRPLRIPGAGSNTPRLAWEAPPEALESSYQCSGAARRQLHHAGHHVSEIAAKTSQPLMTCTKCGL